ncbi:hypothetical protein HOD61_00975 [archaeon]|jgi:uncharacterized protein (DUF2384 family)|nr:hypothetical protein [archaeon]
MNIDDFLTKPEFGGLDDYLTTEMFKTMSEDLIYKMFDVIGSEKKARDWFYSTNPYLKKRPYDFCKKGHELQVELILANMQYGPMD